ncbi:MAG TPA: LysM domain-containing protein, partial [Planctomycetota bacterium]|nr:LysM domain-containing protein [Planctomycetota bacterium]
MLHTPSTRKTAASSLPTVMIVVACAAVACYFAFFRGKAPAPAAAPAVPVVAAPAAPAPVVAAPAPKPPATATVPVDPLAVFNPPAPAPKPAPRIESPKPLPVAFAPKGPVEDVAALVGEGKWREARAKVAAAFANAISDAERMELGRHGAEINRQLLQEKSDPADVELYEIRQGDTLEGIARKFKSLNGVKGTIMLLNNYKENAVLRDGRKVRVAKGTWSAVVDKSLFMMWLCYGGCPFKSYRITIGMPSKE